MVARIGSKKPPRLFISERRKHRHLTQEQVACRLETTKASISRWENGGRDITLKVVAAIAEALDCEPEDLYRDPARPTADELMRGMSEDQRQQVMTIIKALRTSNG